MNFVLIKIQTWLERLNSKRIHYVPPYVLRLFPVEWKRQKFLYWIQLKFKEKNKKHNERKSIVTRHKRPYKLIFYEAFLNRIDAKHREKYLKSGWGIRSIKKLLKRYLGEVA